MSGYQGKKKGFRRCRKKSLSVFRGAKGGKFEHEAIEKKELVSLVTSREEKGKKEKWRSNSLARFWSEGRRTVEEEGRQK